MTPRLSNLGSVLLGFGLFMVAGLLLRGNFAFTGQLLHPFLLVIAAAAIGHGLIEALFAFVIAVAIYLGGLVVYAGSWAPTTYPHVYILFSFVLTAVVLGMVQNSRFRQLGSTRSELEEVRNESERLRQRLQVVNTANQKLNERILGEVTTVQSFADIARRLSVLEEKDLYPALCDLVTDFVHAQECSVYMLNGDRLILMAQRGWDNVSPEARALTRDRDLLWSAVEQRRVLTPLDLEKMPVAQGPDPARRFNRLIVAPIFHPQSGEVMGVISVEKIPFAHLHGNTLGMLGVIAKWAGDSLFNASSFQELSKQLNTDELMPECIPPILLRDRYEQEVARGQRCGAVVVQMQGLRGLDYNDQVWFRKTLYSVLQPFVSERVSLGRYAEEGYALLVPGGDPTELRTQVAEQLKGKFTNHPQAARLSTFVGSATSGPGLESFEGAWQQALKGAQRC